MANLWADLLALADAEDAYRDPRPGPSDVGVLFPPRGCLRQLTYRVQGVAPTDPEPDWLRRAADLGTAIHERVAAARRRAHPGWLVHAKVRVPGLDRDGELDAYDPDTGTVDDVKTQSRRAFERTIERGEAWPDHRAQVGLYALAIHRGGGTPRVCQVTYVNRDSGEAWPDSWTWQRAESEQDARALAAMSELADSVPPVQIPRPERVSPRWSPCNSCRWTAGCWDIPPRPAEPDPDLVSRRAAPEQVAQAARDMIRLRRERADIAAALDWTREVVRARNGETFADDAGLTRRIRWTRGREPGVGGQLDADRVRADYARRGEEPPTLGVAPRVSFPVVE